MNYIFFGKNYLIENGSSQSIEWNQAIIGSVQQTNSTIILLFSEKVEFKSVDGTSFQVTIDAGTRIIINQVLKSVTKSGGNISISLFGQQLILNSYLLSDKNELLFLLEYSDDLARSVYANSLYSKFGEFKTLYSDNIYNKLPVLSCNCNFADSSIDLFTKKQKYFLISDSILIALGSEGGNDGDSMVFTQEMTIDRIRLHADASIQTFLQPELGYLHIHPDTLSMQEAFISKRNELEIQYQMTCVNGFLCLEYSKDKKELVYWSPVLFAAIDPLLLLYSFMDENSEPLALKCVENRFNLNFRAGLDSLISHNSSDFQKTIHGISLNTLSRASLYTLDHRTINWDRKEEQVFRINTVNTAEKSGSLVHPYWLPDDKIVRIKNTAPAAFYSTIKGLWFERKSGLQEKAGCAVEITPVDLGDEAIYHFITLHLNPSDWIISSQYEERETKVYPGNATLTYQIDSRKLSSNGDPGLFKLPATNYLLGTANIIDPDLKQTAVIPSLVQSAVKKINDSFSTYSFESKAEEHIQGFLRKGNAPETKVQVDSLFTYAPVRAAKSMDTLALPLLLRHTTISFVHGDYKNLPVQNTLAGQQNDISVLFSQFQHLWNEYLFLIKSTVKDLQPAVLAIQKIKIILENLTDELKPEDSRVALQSDIYYRLKYRYIIRNESEAQQLLLKINTFACGNSNAIPGLGKRLKNNKVQTLIGNLTPESLSKQWDKGWTSITTEEEKVIYALFDLVYKQFDRSVFNKLVESIALNGSATSDIVTQFTTILDYLRPNTKIDDLVDTITKTVDKPVSTLLSDVAQGIDPYFDKIREIWNTQTNGCPGTSMESIHQAYGSCFDINNFKLLLKDLTNKDANINQKAKSVIDCLEYKLKQEIKTELLNAWTTIKGKTWSEIQTWFTNAFAAYQEDILGFYSFADQICSYKSDLDRYLGLINEISKVKKAEDLKILVTDKDFKQVYKIISDIVGQHYQQDLKSLENAGGSELERIIDKYWDTIVSVSNACLLVYNEYKLWQTILTSLGETIEDIRFDIDQFMGSLQDDSIRLKFLELLINFLLEKHKVTINLADLRVEPPQYIAYSKHLSFKTEPAYASKIQELLNKLHLMKLPLCNLAGSKQWNFSLTESSIYILKLGNDMDFGTILREINTTNKKPGLKNGPLDDQAPDRDNLSPLEQLIADLHPDLKTSAWRGLFILKPFADIRNDELLKSIVGKSSLQMVYTAIGGASHFDSSFSSFNVYGRIKEEAQKIEIALGTPDAGKPGTSDTPDAHFTLVKFDAVIKNTQLESGDVLMQLDFKNLFGKLSDDTNPFKAVYVRGSLPVRDDHSNSPRDFNFAISFHPEIVYTGLLSFLDKLQIRGIKAVRQAGRSVLEINGTLIFKNIGAIVNVKSLALKNFFIILPTSSQGSETPAGKPRGVNFDIGAIEFIIDQPRPLNYLGLELLPTGVGYLKGVEDSLAKSFNQTVMWLEGNGPQAGSGFSYLKIDLHFGKLPALGGTNLQDLRLNGTIGYRIENGNVAGGLHFGINGLDAKELSIDLFRFISIYIKEILIQRATIGDQIPVTFIGANQVELKILDWSPLGNGNLSLAFIHNAPVDGSAAAKQSPDSGLIAAYSNLSGLEIGALKIFWVLLAHNLEFSEDVLNQLLSPDSDTDTQVAKLMNGIFNGIGSRNNENSFNGIKKFTDNQSWLFGASFSLANILDRCAIVIAEQHYYGIMLRSTQSWFREIFGTDTLALAYMPGASKQKDKFRIEFSLPFLNLLGSLQSGLLAFELGVNKDILVDFGFPWRFGNTYLWSRTFSMVEGIYETRLGFYFEKHTDITVSGDMTLTIGAGVAISYGYHVGSRDTFAYAEAGISVTVILMGSVTFILKNEVHETDLLKNSIQRIEVTGVIGIYAYARGGINYWVITAEIRAEVVAALAGHLIYLPAGNSSLTFDATLSVAYEASCRVKIGFIKINFQISGSLAYGVAGRIALN